MVSRTAKQINPLTWSTFDHGSEHAAVIDGVYWVIDPDIENTSFNTLTLHVHGEKIPIAYLDCRSALESIARNIQARVNVSGVHQAYNYTNAVDSILM